MILCNVDKAGEVLTMSYGQHVRVEDMRRCLGIVRDLMEHLKPDFLLLTDLSHLESMEASCAPELGAIMDLCSARGMSTVVRVIPDPNKDIGFDLISHFHLPPPVKTQTHESLAEAIKSLLTESMEVAPKDMTWTQGRKPRKPKNAAKTPGKKRGPRGKVKKSVLADLEKNSQGRAIEIAKLSGLKVTRAIKRRSA